MACTWEIKNDCTIPEPVDCAFDGIILVEQLIPLGKILVGGNDNAAVLLQAYPVHELEEEQGLGLAEFAITDLVNNQARILRETVDQLARGVIFQSCMEPIFLFAIKIFYNSTADMFPYCWLIFAFYQSVGSCPFLNVPFMPPQRKHYFPMSRRPFLPPPT